ncbi:hypothetical protein CJ178_26755 [Rhodococcus sp. ACPA4]|uniref:Uncharacterized protein n=1 Tax=Nocardia globerula TaxID=1818 RepID=A0A652YU27_NOCGL|nr:MULTISPECIES: hypothetical protein [Rhodococcus]NMD61084.1 hypothetical protein [Nocardia globerula]NRI65043.1 hypothetical protein [Rhodococcus sp. MS16]PBC37659.1 hypothetical protein CJ178_26755 [Rhodococcus sp. ACPA4]PVX67363.1 hypothetical protein C8E04_4719 [Rhodococcus globerulus]QXW02413.1 hypothetical protein KYT97_29950 [Rhodococcus globerulus]
MYIRVEEGRVSVEDAGNLRDFHVEVPSDMTERELDEVLRARDFGYARGASAFILTKRIENAAAGVAEMIDYAKSKGWIDEDGKALQAHVVRT